MSKNNKRMEAVNIQLDSNMDADDLGQRISDCVRKLDPDVNVVNLVKVDFGDSSIPFDNLSCYLKNLSDMFDAVNAKNCIFVPIGKRVGVKDIRIDHVKVTTDDLTTN